VVAYWACCGAAAPACPERRIPACSWLWRYGNQVHTSLFIAAAGMHMYVTLVPPVCPSPQISASGNVAELLTKIGSAAVIGDPYKLGAVKGPLRCVCVGKKEWSHDDSYAVCDCSLHHWEILAPH
jgi:hypothetical protein